ncbi:hypothetical protein BX600DRAFT_443839 [Xylariales sp. PMI_506]|nr:hypothetical protein BX600DRAFT_443839 [Xylariales sp. PMI_506]
MEYLIAKHAVLDVMTTMALAQDTLDRKLLKTLFVPEEKFLLDASSHLSQYDPVEITPDELMDTLTGQLAGYTTTQHLLGNPLITFDNNDNPTKGHCRIEVCAYHCIQEEVNKQLQSVTARNTWDMDVEQHEGRWFIRKIVVIRTVPLNRPELYEIARKRTKRRQEKHI